MSFQQTAMDSYGFTSGATGDSSLASNLLKIQVYFTSLNVETIAESPTYQVIFSPSNDEITNQILSLNTLFSGQMDHTYPPWAVPYHSTSASPLQ